MFQVTSQAFGAPLLSALIAGAGGPDAASVGPEALSAASPSGTVSVVLSPPVSGADAAHALIARRGEFVQWVEVETPRFPDAIFAGDDGVLHCVAGGPTAEPIVFGLDAASGELLATASLADLLDQPGAKIDPGQVVAAQVAGGGEQLAVPMACGAIAFVDCSGASDEAIEYAICNAIPSPKHACGARSWLTQARDLERAGDMTAARFALEAAVETAPDDPEVYVALARFEGRRGDPDRRASCLLNAIRGLHAAADGAASERWRLGTAEARLVVEYTECVEEAGDRAALLAALDEMQGLYPCLDHLVLTRAACLLDDGRPEEARDAVDAVLQRLDPADDLAGAYGDVARFHERRGLLAEALAYYEDAYALGDRTEYLLRSLSKVSAAIGDNGRAVRWLELLRDQWSGAITTDTNERRRQRALDRLMGLEDEIAALRRP